MAKTSRKQRKLTRRPDAHQAEKLRLDTLLARVQSLLLENRAAEALDLLESGAARFGRFAAFQSMLTGVYLGVGRYRDAAVHARLALDLDPKTLDYSLSAAIAYTAAEYFSLARRVRQRWLQSAPRDHPLYEEMWQLEEAFRSVSQSLAEQYALPDWQTAEEAGYRLDLGRWALDEGRYAEGLQHSRAAAELVPGWPPPRNNVATALFGLERYDEAIAEAEAVLRELDPDNLHALANLVRYHLIVGHAERAREVGERLAHLPAPEDMDDAVKQAEGLALAERDEDVYRILSRAEKKFGDLPPIAALHLGIAEANLGHPKRALAHLQSAQAQGFSTPLLQETLPALERGQRGRGIAGRFSHTELRDLVPLAGFEEVVQLVKRDEEQDIRDERAWAELLRKYPQMPFVARKLLYEAEQPESATTVLRLLAEMRTPEAVETLREFALGDKGEQNDRLEAVRCLQEIGEWAPGTEVEVWIDGERRLVQPVTMDISEEFLPDYPPAAWDA